MQYHPAARAAADRLPLDWLDRKTRRRRSGEQVRKILESLEFKVEETAPQNVLGLRPELARHQRRHHQGRSGGRSRPHDRLRFHHAGRSADARARSSARIPSAISPSRSRDGRRAGIHRGLQLFVPERRAGAGVRLSTRRNTSKSPIPIAADQNLLRASLLPGILKNIRDNAKHFDSFRLFEIGSEIHKGHEVPHFAAAIFAKDDGMAALLELKRLAECLVPGIIVQPYPARSFEHPQRAAHLLLNAEHHRGRPPVRIPSEPGRNRPRRGPRTESHQILDHQGGAVRYSHFAAFRPAHSILPSPSLREPPSAKCRTRSPRARKSFPSNSCANSPFPMAAAACPIASPRAHPIARFHPRKLAPSAQASSKP